MDLFLSLALLLATYRLAFGTYSVAGLKFGDPVPLGISWGHGRPWAYVTRNQRVVAGHAWRLYLRLPLIPWRLHDYETCRVRWQLLCVAIQVTMAPVSLDLRLSTSVARFEELLQ